MVRECAALAARFAVCAPHALCLRARLGCWGEGCSSGAAAKGPPKGPSKGARAAALKGLAAARELAEKHAMPHDAARCALAAAAIILGPAGGKRSRAACEDGRARVVRGAALLAPAGLHGKLDPLLVRSKVGPAPHHGALADALHGLLADLPVSRRPSTANVLALTPKN